MAEGRPTIPRASQIETPNVGHLQAGPADAGPTDNGPIEDGAGAAEAGPTSIAPKNNQILDCPVCYSLYDHETHLPKVLRCGHTVCLECLRQICATRRTVLRCPSCRKDQAFDGQVEVLPNNFTALHVLDALCDQCKHQIYVDEHLKMCKTCLKNYIQVTTRELNESLQHFDDDFGKLSSASYRDQQAKLIYEERDTLKASIKEVFKGYRELLDLTEHELLDQIEADSESEIEATNKHQTTLPLKIATIKTKIEQLRLELTTAGSLTNGIQIQHLKSLSSEIKELLVKAKAWPQSTIQNRRVHLCKKFACSIENCASINGLCGLCCDRHMLNSIHSTANEKLWYGAASVFQVFDNDIVGQDVFNKPIRVAVSPVDGTLVVVNNNSRRLVFFVQVDYTGGEYSAKHQYEFSKVVEEFGEQGSQFTGVDFDNDGNIYLTDNQHNCIWIYKTNGDRVNRIVMTDQVQDPTGISVDLDSGNMYVVGLDKILVFAPNGLVVGEFMFPEDSYTCPLAVVVKRNKVYVLGDDTKIYIHDKNWRQCDVQETNGRIDSAICVDEYGNILASDMSPQVFFQNPKSNIALVLGGNEREDERYKFEDVMSIAVNKDGDIIVCDFRLNNVKVLSFLYH